MKTKTFFFLCLLLGIGVTQLSAQNGKNGTGCIITWYEKFEFSIHVWNAIGEPIDMIDCVVNVHEVLHFKNGEWTKVPQQDKGEAVSVGFTDPGGIKVGGNGETFKLSTEYQVDFSTGFPLIGYGHLNAQGNQGSHYIIFYSTYWDGDFDHPQIFSFVKAISAGN